MFNSKLNALKVDNKKHEVDDKSSGMAAGLKYASEFSAAVLVGVFFGYLADKFIGTTPWGLLAGLDFWVWCRRSKRCTRCKRRNGWYLIALTY